MTRLMRRCRRCGHVHDRADWHGPWLVRVAGQWVPEPSCSLCRCPRPTRWWRWRARLWQWGGS